MGRSLNGGCLVCKGWFGSLAGGCVLSGGGGVWLTGVYLGYPGALHCQANLGCVVVGVG